MTPRAPREVVLAQREDDGAGVMLFLRGSRAPASLERAVAERLPTLTAHVTVQGSLASLRSPDKIVAAIEHEVAATSFRDDRKARARRRRLRRAATLVGEVLGVIVTLAVIVFIGLVIFLPDNTDKEMVQDYCAYGSVSQAQLDHCVREVTVDDVEYYGEVRDPPTDAGRYALGRLDKCIVDPDDNQIDAGPFCKPH